MTIMNRKSVTINRHGNDCLFTINDLWLQLLQTTSFKNTDKIFKKKPENNNS